MKAAIVQYKAEDVIRIAKRIDALIMLLRLNADNPNAIEQLHLELKAKAIDLIEQAESLAEKINDAISPTGDRAGIASRPSNNATDATELAARRDG